MSSVWLVASEHGRSFPLQRDPEVSGHLSVGAGGPAGVRHAVATGEAVTECGVPLTALQLWDITWPGDRDATVCSTCAIAVLRATETG